MWRGSYTTQGTNIVFELKSYRTFDYKGTIKDGTLELVEHDRETDQATKKIYTFIKVGEML